MSKLAFTAEDQLVLLRAHQRGIENLVVVMSMIEDDDFDAYRMLAREEGKQADREYEQWCREQNEEYLGSLTAEPLGDIPF